MSGTITITNDNIKVSLPLTKVELGLCLHWTNKLLDDVLASSDKLDDFFDNLDYDFNKLSPDFDNDAYNQVLTDIIGSVRTTNLRCSNLEDGSMMEVTDLFNLFEVLSCIEDMDYGFVEDETFATIWSLLTTSVTYVTSRVDACVLFETFMLKGMINPMLYEAEAEGETDLEEILPRSELDLNYVDSTNLIRAIATHLEKFGEDSFASINSEHPDGTILKFYSDLLGERITNLPEDVCKAALMDFHTHMVTDLSNRIGVLHNSLQEDTVTEELRMYVGLRFSRFVDVAEKKLAVTQAVEDADTKIIN